MFVPGQHVIFVGAAAYHAHNESGRQVECDLTKGAVYTVSEVHPPGFQPWPGVEVVVWCISIAERAPDIAYSADLFRPVSKTSTAIVESLKAPAPQDNKLVPA